MSEYFTKLCNQQTYEIDNTKKIKYLYYRHEICITFPYMVCFGILINKQIICNMKFGDDSNILGGTNEKN